MIDISISNPYEGVSKLIRDSDIELRRIDNEELEDLKNMYDDFLELSSRYDDLKTERDDLLTSISDNFQSIPELKQQSGFEFIQSIDEEEYQASKFRTLFSLLRKAYNGSAKAGFTLPSPRRNNDDDGSLQIQNMELSQNLNEAKNIIKALEYSVEDKKEQTIEMNDVIKKMRFEHGNKEKEMEEEILVLLQDVNNLNDDLKKIRSEEKFLQSQNVNLDEGQLRKKVIVLEREITELQEKVVKDQGSNLEIINELNEKLDENAFTIAQLKQSGGKKFATKIGAMSSTFKNSSIGKLLKLDKVQPKPKNEGTNDEEEKDDEEINPDKDRSKSASKSKNDKDKPKPKGGLGALFGVGK